MSQRNRVLALVALAACAGPAAGQSLPFTVTELHDFEVPWAMAFLPDGRVLVTEQKGALQLYTPGGASVAIRGVPAVSYGGQGGFSEVVLHPDFANNGLVYLSYAEAGEGAATRRCGCSRQARAQRYGRRAAGPASHLAADAEGRWRRSLQSPHRVRRRPPLDHLRRPSKVRPGAGHERQSRQGRAAQRGRLGAARQPVRGARRCGGADLVARATATRWALRSMAKASCGTSKWGRWAATS